MAELRRDFTPSDGNHWCDDSSGDKNVFLDLFMVYIYTELQYDWIWMLYLILNGLFGALLWKI